MILEDTDWYFPFDELPLVKFPGIEKPEQLSRHPAHDGGSAAGEGNEPHVSQVVEHKNLTLKPQVLAPTGSLPDRVTNEPGRTVFYNPINGAIPQWRDIPSLPSVRLREPWATSSSGSTGCSTECPSQRDQLPARIDSPGAST
jgi:hypothetical protein